MKKVLVIINPTAGGEKALYYKDKLKRKLKKYFDEIDIKITEKAHDATEFASQASDERYEAVVAFGGDGTINEVISGIAEKSYIPKLGIIPGGTGNLLSRLIGINQDINKAIKEFDPNYTQKIDIGKSNDRYFGYIFSIGSVSEAIHNVGIEEKTKYGMLAYIAKTMKSIVNDNMFSINIKTENGEYVGEASQIIVLLSSWFGNKKIFSGDKAGYGNLLILKDSSFMTKLALLPDLINGKVIDNDQVEYIRAKEIEITSPEDLETDLDGDAGDKLPVTVKILEQHIEIYGKNDITDLE